MLELVSSGLARCSLGRAQTECGEACAWVGHALFHVHGNGPLPPIQSPTSLPHPNAPERPRFHLFFFFGIYLLSAIFVYFCKHNRGRSYLPITYKAKREEVKTTAKRGGKSLRKTTSRCSGFEKTPFLTINSLAGRARLGVFGGGGHAALRRPLVVSSRHGHALLRVLQGLALGALVKGRSQKEISNHKCVAWCFRWRHAK